MVAKQFIEVLIKSLFSTILILFAINLGSFFLQLGSIWISDQNVHSFEYSNFTFALNAQPGHNQFERNYLLVNTAIFFITTALVSRKIYTRRKQMEM